MTTPTNTTTRDRVITELEGDPQVEPSRIGVSVAEGVVILSGKVPSYSDRTAAVKAAQRVKGVTVIADELQVGRSRQSKHADADIADDIAGQIRSTSEIADTVQAEVLMGYVTLRGEVGLSHERYSAERAIRYLPGVRGVSNEISVRPDEPQVSDVEQRVHDALANAADIDARAVRITATGGTIHLHGTVHSDTEKQAVELAGASVPGVSFVDNRLLVAPC